ncbi:DAHP synthetase I family protein [Labrenzia sp. MBR-25]|jgi:3-deoxy-D-manno-octulosonic acid (KDO) 8-phosphate synthase
MPTNVARGILEPHVRIVTTLMVDLLGIGVLPPTSNDAPIFFDVTHALQMRDAAARASGGGRLAAGKTREWNLGRAGLAVGLARLFVEVHPNPDQSKCDGPSALPFAQLRPLLEQMKAGAFTKAEGHSASVSMFRKARTAGLVRRLCGQTAVML